MNIHVTAGSARTALLLWGALAGWTALWGWTAAAIAEDDFDRQLLESLEWRRESDSPESLVNRLLENTQSARNRLAAGQFDEQTQSIQQQILDDIDALLDQTGFSPPGSPSPPTGDPSGQASDADGTAPSHEQPGGTADTGPDAGTDTQPSTDPNAASRESEQRTTAAEETDAARAQRLGLATAAWGHLPPKVREEMRSAFSETFLPEYDELIRRYYEALATRRELGETRTRTRPP